MAGTIQNLQGKSLRVGGTQDHVHMLFGLKATHALADVVREVKKSSSSWMKDHNPTFAWQEGYAAFSVGFDARAQIITYIESQEEHHRRFSALEELVSMLEAAGISYDPAYLE